MKLAWSVRRLIPTVTPDGEGDWEVREQIVCSTHAEAALRGFIEFEEVREIAPCVLKIENVMGRFDYVCELCAEIPLIMAKLERLKESIKKD